MKTLKEVIANIQPVDAARSNAIQAQLDDLTKPQGSLGRLEELAKRYCLITGKDKPVLKKKIIFTCAGDHGVTNEGVSAFPAAVTPQMVYNFLRGGAGVNVLASHAGARVIVVDMGVDHDFEPAEGLEIRKIAKDCGMTMAEIATKWALAGQGITCCLVGARSVRKLEENVRAASQPLPAAIIEELNLATQPVLQKLGDSFDYYESFENNRTR